MNNTPFDHGFTTPLSDKIMAEMIGYSKAMRNIYSTIESVTQFNPENRMIDSIALLDKITATVASINAVIDKELATIDDMEVKVLSATKNDES